MKKYRQRTIERGVLNGDFLMRRYMVYTSLMSYYLTVVFSPACWTVLLSASVAHACLEIVTVTWPPRNLATGPIADYWMKMGSCAIGAMVPNLCSPVFSCPFSCDFYHGWPSKSHQNPTSPNHPSITLKYFVLEVIVTSVFADVRSILKCNNKTCNRHLWRDLSRINDDPCHRYLRCVDSNTNVSHPFIEYGIGLQPTTTSNNWALPSVTFFVWREHDLIIHCGNFNGIWSAGEGSPLQDDDDRV